MKQIPINDTFLKSTQDFIVSQQLFETNARLLVGVSGGVDSVVLTYTLFALGYELGICHVNFGLRGNESDEDAYFVDNLGFELGIPVYSVKVDAQKLSIEIKKSIQETARKIRYDYFEECRQKKGYDFICTAHHLNDQIETVLFRWIKGAGLKGLRGIPSLNQKIRRPFLGQTKEQITAFSQKYSIAFREDSSNRSDKYDRNYIRHHLITPLEKINPSFPKTFLSQLGILQSTYDFYQSQVKCFWMDKTQTYNHFIIADVSKIPETKGSLSLIYELLNKYSFQSGQCKHIHVDILTRKSGTLYNSNTHEVLLFRQELIIKSKQRDKHIEERITFLGAPVNIQSPLGLLSTEKQFDKTKYAVFLHEDFLPITVRTWKKGDYFKPAGMNGKKKKLSDFFNDEGINRFERNQMLLLCQDNRVLWVPGLRSDERLEKLKNGKVLYYVPNQIERVPIDVFE